MVAADTLTLDLHEIQQFEALAHEWWAPSGAFKPLHMLNPARLTFVQQQILKTFGPALDPQYPYQGLKMIDIGCGGGILSEPLARCGAEVTGIDAGQKAIAAARWHSQQEGLSLQYHQATPEQWVKTGEVFDVVIAMEVVEHVAQVSEFVKNLHALAKPGGIVILSTLNRTFKSFGIAIVGAEYLLRLLPRGTHDWHRFLTPAELARYCRQVGLNVIDIQGMKFRPWLQDFKLGNDVSVNYLLSAQKALTAF